MEQQPLKKCPIGIQTFEKIIEGDFLYIDKTEYVYRIALGDSNYYFLSCPRRFGKSLLVSTAPETGQECRCRHVSNKSKELFRTLCPQWTARGEGRYQL